MRELLARIFSFLDRIAIQSVGERYNPFTRMGTLSIGAILLAIVTGVLLRPFYSLNVHSAHESVRTMVATNAWGSGWWPGFATTRSSGRSSHLGCLAAMTAASATSG